MKTLLLFILLAPFILFSQNVPILKFSDLEKKISHDSDTLYLVNYWATWCKPCVEELPDFIKLNEEYKNKKFKMFLVTLDFPQHIESRVIPFIKKNNIDAQVILLDDDANIWINKVDKNWNGSIPVTQFILKDKKQFYNGTLNYNELKNRVESILNQ